MGFSSNFSEQFCIEVSPSPVVMTIFGASGDLARLKLFPALCRLFQQKLFHPQSQIIAFARTPQTTEVFREKLREYLHANCTGDCTQCPHLDDFISRIHYLTGDYNSEESYCALSAKITAIEKKRTLEGNRLFYLSVPSLLYAEIVSQLARIHLISPPKNGVSMHNVIIEKPFGYDTVSAQKLDHELSEYLAPQQIYRIDHYLGKETIQNIIMLRFANRVYEPLWNHEHIDSIQITAAETTSIGNRAGYYDTSGCVRDMFQNHILQTLALVAMEPPEKFDANALNRARKNFLDSILTPRPEDWARGQYEGYREERGVAPDSQTETYAAVTLYSDAPRWRGVPFYLRSGKCLDTHETTITIQFKHATHAIFGPLNPVEFPANFLQIFVQPEAGMVLSTMMKKPGPKLCIGTLDLVYRYADAYDGVPQEAYERLILEAMLGDPTLFIQADAVLASWRILDPTLKSWAEHPQKFPLYTYSKGSSGPKEALDLPRKHGNEWITRKK